MINQQQQQQPQPQPQITTNTSDEDLPLIKIITVRDMINQYSTYLNNLKQLELIKLGSSKTLKP